MNLLTVKQVAAKLSCAPSYVYRLLDRDPTFPRSISIGLGEEKARGVRWVEADVTNWLLTRIQKKEVLDENGRVSSNVHPSTGEEVAA